MLDLPIAQIPMTDDVSPYSPRISEDAARRLDAFFASGGLTIYATTASSWRWRACAGEAMLLATVIDPQSLFDAGATANPETHRYEPGLRQQKPFEHSRLVQWLTREASKTGPTEVSAPAGHLTDDDVAYAGLLHFASVEWAALKVKPPITASEIMHFNAAHNAALSDIESAFLPDKVDLPAALASFYIRYLTKARRDVEAALVIAQSSNSTRLPHSMADALALAAFEGAALEPVRHDGSDYAASCAEDTSAFIDAAIVAATRKLMLPIDHPDHLLRLNVMDITRLASQIVEETRLAPFRFLLKAKQLYMARCDVCRFPPLQRFATSVGEHDLNADEPWVQRIAAAYARIFPGQSMPAPLPVQKGKGKKAGKNNNKILGFSRR